MDALVSVSAPRPYGLLVNTLASVYISAKNVYGFGTASAVNTVGAKVRYTAIAPNTPTVGSIATDTQVTVTWSELTYGVNTGLVAITSYNLYSDSGSGGTTYNEIYSGLTTSYLATGLTGGLEYKFKVRATNMYGPGDYSGVLSYTPKDVPSKVAIPTVIISTTAPYTSVFINWDAPNSHSSAITEYDVRFLTNTGLYLQAPTSCVGTV